MTWGGWDWSGFWFGFAGYAVGSLVFELGRRRRRRRKGVR